jgi:hypothetical protein
MPEQIFDEVKQTAEQLSPEERFQLFNHLAGLPDSGIKTIPATQPEKPLQAIKGADYKGELQELKFQYNCQIQEDQVVYSLDGAEIFRVVFNSENCTNVFFDKLKSSDSFLKVSPEQRTRVYAAVREVIAEQGQDVTDEQIKQIEGEALKALELQLLKESIERATKQVSKNLPQVVVMIWQKILHVMTFSGANALRDILQLSEQKFGAEEIKKALFQPEWERLKILSGISRGGRRERKGFVWTNEKKKAFYKEAESLPEHKGKSIWQFVLDELIEQEFDAETVAWLKSRSFLKVMPKELLDSAINTWRKYLPDEAWSEMKPDDKPRAFEFRHALRLLDYPDEFAYSTLESYYYDGKKLSDSQT